MEIDWFTVGAQLVNFLLLFWLLSRFLYRPIVDAVEKREATIAGRLEEAESREQEAEETRREYEKQQTALADQRDEIIEEAKDEAERRYDDMIEELRDEVDRRRTEWFERLDAEKRRHLEEFTDALEHEIFRVTEEAFRDLADREVEAQIVDTFAQKLDEAAANDETEGVVAEMNSELDASGGDVSVRTSFRPTDEQRQHIVEVIRRHLPDEVDIEFEQDERLVAGIELRVGARRFGWNLRAYLDSLQAELRDDDEPNTDFEHDQSSVYRSKESTG